MFTNRDTSKSKLSAPQRKSSITLNGSVPLFDPQKQKLKRFMDKSKQKQPISVYDMMSQASHEQSLQSRRPNDLTKRMLYEKKEAEQKHEREVKQLKKQLSQLQEKYDKQTIQYNKMKENYKEFRSMSKIQRQNSCIKVQDIPMGEQQIIEDMKLLSIPKLPLDGVKLGKSFDYVQLDIPLENFMQTPRQSVQRKQSEDTKQLLSLPIDWLASQPNSPARSRVRETNTENEEIKALKTQLESLKAQLEKYKKNQHDYDKIERIRSQLNEAKKIMMKEYEKLLQIKQIVKDIEMPTIGKLQNGNLKHIDSRKYDEHSKEDEKKQENAHRKLKQKKVSFEYR